jgi:MoaA/NifB/PqqE/SkfB family radical SAM enzyme
MSWQAFQRVIDELSDLKVFFVNLSGGEPFTHPEIERLLEYAHEHIKHVVVLSNGTILKPSHARTIESIVRTKGSFPIQVSLDAVQSDVNLATRSKSEKTLRNLGVLNALGANIVIAMVINRYNAAYAISSIIELSRYTRYFHIMSVQSVKFLNGSDEQYKLSEEELLQIWDQIHAIRSTHGLHIDTPVDEYKEYGCATGAPCMAAFSHLVIDPSLKVRPCDRLVTTVIGDMKETSLAEIWRGPGVRPILESSVPYCRREEFQPLVGTATYARQPRST